MTALTSGAPLPRLVDALASAGWGDLSSRDLAGARRVLHGLTVLLPRTSAQAAFTIHQLADVTGYCRQWVSRILRRLEAIGLVEWRRGWLDRGHSRPGYLRVHKSALLDLVKAARAADRLGELRRVRAGQLAARVATTLRWSTQHNRPKPLVGEMLTQLPPSPLRGNVRRAQRPDLSTGDNMTGLCPHGYVADIRTIIGPDRSATCPECTPAPPPPQRRHTRHSQPDRLDELCQVCFRSRAAHAAARPGVLDHTWTAR